MSLPWLEDFSSYPPVHREQRFLCLASSFSPHEIGRLLI